MVLLIVAPLNIEMNWLIVWECDLGFIGASLTLSLV